MRWRWTALAAFVTATAAAPAHGQPIDPMEGVTPVPGPATPLPAPAPATAAPPAQPPAAAPEERKTLTSFGIGPTYFATTGRGREVSRPGVVLHVASRIPFDDNLGLGLRFAWGLTEFRRVEDFTRAGYRVGEWTTEAYKDVYGWAAQVDDWRLFRWMGAFFAFAVLWVPYIVSGLCYVLSPVAPTTYLEADVTFNYDIGSDRAGSGPYFKGGLGLVGYFHPQTDKLLGGIGPTAGFGVRAGKADIGAHATWLPPSLHGENAGDRTNVFIGSLTIGVSGY